MTKKLISNGILVVFGLLIGVGLLELGLRLVKPYHEYYSLAPGTRIESHLNTSEVFPGLDDHFVFTVNDFGYRSQTQFGKGRYGILAIGASTTECSLLGDEQGWTALLENSLNQSGMGSLTLGNVGVSGMNSGHHLLQMEHLVSQYEYIDMVIVLVGINDLMRFLEMGEDYFPSAKDEQLMRRTFKIYPPEINEKWYQRTQTWTHLRYATNQYRSRRNNLTEKELNESLKIRQEKNAALDTHQSLPSLQIISDDYRKNIEEMVALARSLKVKLVLVTQPVLWKEEMTPDEYRLASVTTPVVNGKVYAPGALYQGMEQLNDVLREVKFQNEEVALVDLAKALPKDTTVFYDHCHFNKSGARQVAKIIENDLIEILKEERPLGQH